MPFTLAHAAAALPFRRLPVVPSALVVGTMAPDIEYFLRFGPRGGFGHTFTGAFLVSLPLALLVLWMFHALVKAPLIQLSRESIRLRLIPQLRPFRFAGPGRFFLILVSALLGIATHIVWDSFTHRNTWPYRHWALLGQPVPLPIVGDLPCYKILQHGSSILGVLILAAWLVNWYRTTEPLDIAEDAPLSPSRKVAILGSIAAIALLGGILRAAAPIALWNYSRSLERILAQSVVTTMAIAWWLIVAYGVTLRKRSNSGAWRHEPARAEVERK